jgi:geranylgeranyl diphosphate synthase type II
MEYIKKEIIKFQIETKLKNILFYENTERHSVKWGMNYITFSPSKRIRPLLLLESNFVFSKLDEDSYILSAALELIHTYSLVHDDLPCMDDDDLRRGVETLHKIKNEAYAVLVGDALLTRGFGLLSEYSKNELLPYIIKIFNEKCGCMGMINGQFLDLEGEGKSLTLDEINEINIYKTGAMFELALMAGAVNGGAPADAIKNMECLGNVIGKIFQLTDDILDIVGDEELIGKKTGSDEKNKKSSIPLIVGLDESYKLLNKYKNEANEYIKKIPSNNDFFYMLINYLIERKK